MQTVQALIHSRVDAYDWWGAACDLDAHGWAMLNGLLEPDECATIAAMYPEERHFRSQIIMARHGFGRGEYKYLRIRCRRSSLIFEHRSIRDSRSWRTYGITRWESG